MRTNPKSNFLAIKLLPALMATLIGVAVLPLSAELEAGGLEGNGGLRGSDGLGGSGGLGAAKLRTGGLQGGRLESSSVQGAKLEPAKPQAGAKLLNSATLKRKATELAKSDLGTKSLQGATSTIPRSQVGELLYDVAGAILLLEENISEVAVGYYMAVLADPQGERFDDAVKQLNKIFLDKDLEHSEAVRLYDGGLETMKSLVELKIGLTEGGYQSGLGTLQEVKTAYQQRRAREKPEEEEGGLDALQETAAEEEQVNPDQPNKAVH
ncbi:MAG: hypothetical protein K9N23_10805 [Akkermansiaceae bacterium]|nr:hypothetical protein [Akkermansiaceae bacterium]MCF7732171.1 hypothetical protein [Akkermansiaceae bacterium]